MGVGQQRGALLALPACFLHRQKRFEGLLDVCRLATVHDIDGAERGQSVPVLAQLLARRSGFLDAELARHERPRRFGEHQRFDAAQRKHLQHRGMAWIFGVERFQADDVRQLRAVFDRREKRRDHFVGERGIDHGTGEEGIVVRQRFQHRRQQRRGLAQLQAPRRRPACAARRPAPRPAASRFWRSRCRGPPATRPGS